MLYEKSENTGERGVSGGESGGDRVITVLIVVMLG